MEYENLKQPTYKLQEGENKRHYFYFKIKLTNGLSQHGLEVYLKEKYDDILTESWQNRGKLRKELKKYFAPYDITKILKKYDFENQKCLDLDYIPLHRSSISVMSMEGCWVLREKDFEADEAEDDLREFKAQHRKSKREDFPKKQQVKSLVLNKIIENAEHLTLSQINQGTQAYVNLDDNDDKDLGLDKQKHEVNLHGEVEAEVKSDLQKDIFDYQKQLLDGSLAKRTKNRFRKQE
jgi:hypothetical protein